MKRNTTFFAIFLFLFFLDTPIVVSQENHFLKASESDPEARVLLDEMTDVISAFKIMEMEFDFELVMTDGNKYLDRAKIIQKGKKFRFEMGNQLVVNDGSYNWVYLRDRNEVQITDLDGSEQSLTPSYFFNFHQNEDFVYAITSKKKMENGDPVCRIDFKPLDEFSEYAKIGLDINEKITLPEKIIVILKDGGRYVFNNIRITKLSSVEPETFIFKPSDFEGIHIEDLRLD